MMKAWRRGLWVMAPALVFALVAANGEPQVQWQVYTTAYDSMDSGAIDFESHTFKVMLASASYSPDLTADLALTDASSNRVGTDQTVTVTRGTTEWLDSIRITADATWSGPGTFRYAVLYDDSHAADQVVALLDYGGSNVVPGGLVFRLQSGVVFRRDIAYSAGDILFQMDLSEGAYPLAGFDALRDTTENVYDLSQRLGVGPSGENAYVIDIGGESTSSPPRQPDVGWYVELDTLNDPIGYGETVYVRILFRWMADVVCLGWNFGGAEDDAEAKFHMIADTSPGGDRTGRTMIRLRCENAADSTSWGVSRANSDQRCNGDGTFIFPNAFDTPNDTTWVAIQYRLTWSSSSDATDGSYALWINNSDAENPNCDANHTTLQTAYPGVASEDLAIINATGSWYRFEMGFFWNSIPDLSRGGDFGFEIAGYEIGTTFDATWGN